MISAIMLAGGQSSRMNGENKLIKEIEGIPLIKHSIKNILASGVDEVIIVLGFEKEIVEKCIEENKKIKCVYNKNYKTGIASSIKTGLINISKNSEAFFICLGDMPKVNQNVYNKMIKVRYKYNKKLKPQYKKEIFIPTYEGQKGNPILFSKFFKEKIMQINGDVGGKKILELNKNKILNILFNTNSVILDFDTQDSFNLL